MSDHLAVLEELAKADGCFEAALTEGWTDALAEGDIESVRDLWGRRISMAREYVVAAIALMREQSEKPAFSFAVKTIGVPHNEGMQFIGVVYRPFECAELPSEGCRYAAHEIEQEPAE